MLGRCAQLLIRLQVFDDDDKLTPTMKRTHIFSQNHETLTLSQNSLEEHVKKVELSAVVALTW